MTAKEIQKRNVKSNQLKVIQTETGQIFVESSQGKILYNVVLNNDEKSCTCGDFARNSKNDEGFKCKHILAVENSIQDNDIESATFLDKNIPRLKERFIQNIKGKDFVLYAGVLDLAQQKGLLRLEVELIRYPSKENGYEAICRATAEGKNGELFIDIGDANPTNCTEKIAKHLIRLASTRSKSRALKDLCNVGIACVEELESADDVIESKTPQTTRKPTVMKPKTSVAAPNKPEENTAPAKTENVSVPVKKEEPKVLPPKPEPDSPSMSEAQKRAIYNLSRRRGISIDDLELIVQKDYNTTLEHLTSAEASGFIRNLQQAA
jgi:predicted nucleic acid-binding Zn finger protein